MIKTDDQVWTEEYFPIPATSLKGDRMKELRKAIKAGDADWTEGLTAAFKGPESLARNILKIILLRRRRPF
jgi:hypothetical protein